MLSMKKVFIAVVARLIEVSHLASVVGPHAMQEEMMSDCVKYVNSGRKEKASLIYSLDRDRFRQRS